MASGNSKTSASPEAALSEQVADLRADIAAITRTLGEMSKKEASNITALTKDRIKAIGDRGQEKIDEAGELIKTVEKQASSYVRDKPLQSLAIATALGLIAGYMTRSK